MATWLVVAGLGTYHGLNPAMGWLFAVALGLQEERGSAVLHAIPPLVAGHALSVGAVALLAIAASVVVPADVLRLGGAGVLLMSAALLARRRSRHPRSNGIGMRTGVRELTAWSFIMSSAHGSGLMLLPVLLRTGPAATHGAHVSHQLTLHEFASHELMRSEAVTILAVHTAAMIVALTAAALLAYRVLGLGFLRRAWINFDVVWIGSLVVAAVVTLLS